MSDDVVTGQASVVIAAPMERVFEALADMARMGDWSPEFAGGRWIDGADGPALGAKFEGDNKAAIGPVTLKSWTTVSEVTAYEPHHLFEFVAAGYTTWRYELTETDGGTRVTESFSYPQYDGVQRFLYETVMRRSKTMVGDVEKTLAQLKAALEA